MSVDRVTIQGGAKRGIERGKARNLSFLTVIGDLNHDQLTKTKENQKRRWRVSRRTPLNEQRCSWTLILLHQHKQVITLQANYLSLHCITPLCHLHNQKFTHHAISPMSFKPSVRQYIIFSDSGDNLPFLFSVTRGSDCSWMTENEWQTKQTPLHFPESSRGWKKHIAPCRQGAN